MSSRPPCPLCHLAPHGQPGSLQLGGGRVMAGPSNRAAPAFARTRESLLHVPSTYIRMLSM